MLKYEDGKDYILRPHDPPIYNPFETCALIRDTDEYKLFAYMGANYGRDRSLIMLTYLGHATELRFSWRLKGLERMIRTAEKALYQKCFHIGKNRPRSKRFNGRRRLKIIRNRRAWARIVEPGWELMNG